MPSPPRRHTVRSGQGVKSCQTRTPAQQTQATDLRRGSRIERGYDQAWVRLSEQVRREQHYLCQPCLRRGVILVATGPIDHRTGKPKRPIVDHIIPVHVRPDLRLDRDNCQVICLACHRRKTADDLRRYGPPKHGTDAGPDVSG